MSEIGIKVSRPGNEGPSAGWRRGIGHVFVLWIACLIRQSRRRPSSFDGDSDTRPGGLLVGRIGCIRGFFGIGHAVFVRVGIWIGAKHKEILILKKITQAVV